MPKQCLTSVKKKSWVWIQFDKCSHVPTKRNAQGYNCKPLLMGLWSSSNNVRKQLAIQLLFWPGAHFLLQHIWWKSVRFPGLTRTRFCSQLLRSPRDWREPALVMWAGAVHYGHSHAPAFFDKFIHQYSITCWENWWWVWRTTTSRPSEVYSFLKNSSTSQTFQLWHIHILYIYMHI